MRFLVCVAPVLATEIDQESLLQISSVNRHSLSNLQDQLESRANKNSATSQDFDAAMEEKPHKEGSCDAEAFGELTDCLTIGGSHLSDVLTGDVSMEEIVASLSDVDCDTLVKDMQCFRRSECYDIAVNKFDVTVQVPNADGSGSSAVSPATLCADAGTEGVLATACQMTPKAMCGVYEGAINPNVTCDQEGCGPMGEVEGLETGVCDENAGSDFYIRTEQGCRDAVQQFADANVETLQAELDAANARRRRRKPKVSIKYHKKLAKWRKKNAEGKPMGCYLHHDSKSQKIRGYFNPYSQLTEEENRKQDKTDSRNKKIETLCKSFDASNGAGSRNGANAGMAFEMSNGMHAGSVH
jgi:hypothetical protein